MSDNANATVDFTSVVAQYLEWFTPENGILGCTIFLPHCKAVGDIPNFCPDEQMTADRALRLRG